MIFVSLIRSALVEEIAVKMTPERFVLSLWLEPRSHKANPPSPVKGVLWRNKAYCQLRCSDPWEIVTIVWAIIAQ